MMTLDFTHEELEILNEMLLSCISDLRSEIVHTERMDYKDMLHRREDLLKKMHAAIAAALQESAR